MERRKSFDIRTLAIKEQKLTLHGRLALWHYFASRVMDSYFS